jgi:hypothetical protein
MSDLAAMGLNPGSTPQTLVDVYVVNIVQLRVGACLSLLAFALQIVFLGPLWARVRAGSDWLAVIAVVGGAAAAVATWLITALVLTIMVTAAEYRDAGAARLLILASWDSARVAAAPFAAMLAACALAGIRHGAFPRWLNVLTLVFLALTLVGLLPFGPAGLFGMVGGGWVLIASVYLAVTRTSLTTSPPRRGEAASA